MNPPPVNTSSPLILVVDDDPAIHNYLSVLLTAHGYRVLHASNGAEALLSFKAQQPELVLTDVVMPEHGGVALIQAVRALDAHIPIVAMSALPSSNLEMMTALGANAMLQKPLEMSPLVSVLWALCQLHRSQRQKTGL